LFNRTNSSTRLRLNSSPREAQLEPTDPTRDKQWDHRLLSHPGSTVFHSAGWAKTLQETYGFAPGYLAVKDEHSLRALLPLMEARSSLLGTRGVSLPFTDECPPLLSAACSVNDLAAEALREGKKRHWKYWEGRNGFVQPSGLSSTGFYGHRLQLINDPRQLFQKCENSVRRAIRKAERMGLSFKMGCDASDLKTFYALHCQTRKKHGLPPQPYSFFEHLRKHLLMREQGFVAIASHGLEPVAALVFLHLGRKAVYKFGASDERYQQFRGMNFGMWKAIEWLAQNQFTELTFGRTSSSNEGLRRFKLGWGTEEYPIVYSRYDFKVGGYVPGKDHASGWHNRLFRSMPLPVLRWTGRLLYPHLV